MPIKNIQLLPVLIAFIYYPATSGPICSLVNANRPDSLSPVETKVPNSDYRPTFAGQTRIKAIKTITKYKVEKIAEKVGNPFAIVAMPDGRLMVTIKSGYMEIHDKNGLLVKKITGFPGVVYAGQGGLLDVAFDPKFTTNKIMYWSFSQNFPPRFLPPLA